MDDSNKAFHAFLSSVSKDVSARSAYQADPIGTMKKAKLSESQIIAVLSQDPSKIQAELGGDDASIRVRVTIIVTVEL